MIDGVRLKRSLAIVSLEPSQSAELKVLVRQRQKIVHPYRVRIHLLAWCLADPSKAVTARSHVVLKPVVH